MRRMLAGLIALLAACMSGPAPAQSVYAITNVTLVPMDSERLVPNRTVILRDGRIAAIEPAASARIPQGATRIDGTGRFLMPGLSEMHAHIPPNPGEAQWTQDVLFLYAANGITFARGMSGAPHHVELRERAARGEIASPRLYVAGPALGGSSLSPKQGSAEVRRQKQAGFDMLKIQTGLTRATYDAIAATAREVQIPFAGHVPEAVGLVRAMEAGQATVDHLDGYVQFLVGDALMSDREAGIFGYNVADRVNEARLAQIVRRTRASGMWNVPTHSIMRHLLLSTPDTAQMEAWPEIRYMPAPILNSWKAQRSGYQRAPTYDAGRAVRFMRLRERLIKSLHDAGAGLLLGSDAPQWFNVPGFSLHRELSYLIDAGLTPYQALTTGTRNVSRFLGNERDFGTIAIGRRSELVLLAANPLVDVRNAQRVEGVMLGQRWLPKSEIAEGLAAIAARQRS